MSDIETLFGLCDEVLTCKTGAELRALQVRLDNTKGILDTERRQIKEAIDRQYCRINAEAVGPQKGRW